MRVLIVEDNEFNAFCLRRLLESVLTGAVSVSVVDNSHYALSLIYATNLPDLVIIDGNLGVPDNGLHCNGPELANILLYKYPHLPIVAWTDSEAMRQAFSQVFEEHDRLINDFSFWNKTVSLDCISNTWAHYFGVFISGNSHAYAQRVNARYA